MDRPTRIAAYYWPHYLLTRMPVKASGPAHNPRIIDRWEDGVGWIAYPNELMQRASHAIAIENDVWVIDPVDADGIDSLLAEYGSLVGVVVLLDRHTRDAAKIARRHDVPVYVPANMSSVARSLDAPVERFTHTLADTGLRVETLVDWPLWQEIALVSDDLLITGDALGTADYFRTAEERLGIHPFLRLAPPRQILSALAPDRILVGHGSGITDDAATALETAITGARKRIPRLYIRNLKALLTR